jgi:NAD(P)-dependent dehydrogenase (short-subunit alcohol dehydrogenase family)
MSEVVPGRYGGKVAVVTGGASGIGEAVVRRLVAEGAKVVAGDINDERLEALQSELGDAVATVHADVREEGDVEALVAAATARFGGLHAGFNVAGLGGGGLIVDMPADGWQFTLDVCLNGVLWGIKHEAKAMIEHGVSGSIVNVSSLNSEVPMFGGAAYCTAKAGVAMLSKCGALELAESGISVNAVSPGLTDTPLTALLSSVPGARDAYMERIPMKRAATPEDIASACLYLGSDDAKYVSGTNLFVDGAWATSGYPDLRPYLAAIATEA